jgi:hypothetical protein
MEGSMGAEREVEGNVLVSSDLPRITLRVDEGLRFVGRLQFVLYDFAEADVFVFAEADEGGRLSRWVIVQFEGYLESNSYTYNYSSPTTVRVGSHEYLHDYYVADRESVSEPERPGSDAERVSGLLREKGYVEPVRSMRVRLVRLIGEERRRELLLIYGESLDERTELAGRLPANAFLGEEHAEVAEGLLRRALGAIEVMEG